MLSDARASVLFRAGFGLLCLAKSYDFYERLPGALDRAGWVIVAVWFGSSIAVTVGRGVRAGLIGLIVAGVASFSLPGGIYNQHIYLIVSIATALLLVGGRERWLLLKVQCTIVYVFAALTKVNPGYLSGGRLETSMAQRPAWWRLGLDTVDYELVLPVLAVASVATEAGLAVGLWWRRTRHAAVAVGVGFHAIMVVMMTDSNWASANRLAVFSGLMVLLYLSFYVQGPTGVEQRHGN